MQSSMEAGVWLLVGICAIAAAADSADSITNNVKRCPQRAFTPNMAASKEQAQVKVLVPNIQTLRQFVNCSDPARVHGFCIDVFEKALSILLPSSSSSPNMSIHYSCFNFSSSPGNASTGPTYNDMVDLVANGTYDAVVGDVTIAASRLSRVDFTHHYMESGVVILGKVVHDTDPPWLFFGWPFSLRMWCTIVGAFLLVGFLVCSLELKDNPELVQGSIAECAHNISWFMVEALIFLEKDIVKSTISRLVVVAWVFFVLLLGASYTAGLSSFLTASNLSPPTYDIISLKESGQNIGYRRGSIVKDVLTTRFQIPIKRLVPLRTVSEYVGNITRGPNSGGVLAIVDELPYVNIILANLSSSTCDFSISGPQLTQQGFGLGFNKERNLATAFSIAVLNLTESGCLQQLQEDYRMSASTSAICSGLENYSNKVTWKSSVVLFILFCVALIVCISIHFVKKYIRPRQVRKRDHRLHVVDDSTTYILRNMVHRHHRGGDQELDEYPFY